MAPKDSSEPVVTPELLLYAYTQGIFPMAESRDATGLFWVDPTERGILPLDGFHVSRSLGKELRRDWYAIWIDRHFTGVVQGCADRPETWINAEIAGLYRMLHRMGFAHSVEVWEGERLVGGVYGVAIGGAFFGESMFSRRTNASKIALAWLVGRLKERGFRLLDTQFLTPHLASLGGIEISRAEYRRRLAEALEAPARPFAAGRPERLR